MVKKTVRSVGLPVLSGLLAAALLVIVLTAGCTGASKKPVSARIGRLTDLTGPYAAISPHVDAGLRDYVEYYNRQFGGIEGIRVEILFADVKDDASLSVDAYRRFKEAGALVVSAISSGQTLAVKRLVEEDRIPMVTQATNLALFMPPNDYIWGAGMSSPGDTVAALQWFDTRVWDRARMGKTWKVGFIVRDADSKNSLPGMYQYSDDNGIEMVGTEITPVTQLDFSVNIRRLMDAGANVVFISQPGTSAGIILREMQELGMLAPLETAIRTPGKVIPLVSDSGFSMATMRAVPEAAGTVYGATPWAAWFEEDKYPGIKTRNGFMRQKYGDIWHSAQQDGDAYSAGWNASRIIIAAIERAVKAVGWDRLDGRAIVQTGLKGLKLTADMSGDVSYADYDGDRIAVESVRGAGWSVVKGAREPLGDFFRVDMKYYVTKYSPQKSHPGMLTE